MKLKLSIQSGLKGLATNKRRSFLTILGIVIGIVTIMLILALGEGARRLIVSEIQSIGSDIVVVIPGRFPTSPVDVGQTLGDSLTERDLDLLRRGSNVPNVSQVIPVNFGIENAQFEGETFQLTVLGGTEDMASLFDLFPEDGQFYHEDDVKTSAQVVVIGNKVKEELFGASDAVGKRLKIAGRNYRVIGVLPQKGAGTLFNFDEIAFMPYTTVQNYVLGVNYFSRLMIEVVDERYIPQVVEDIERTLRDSHGIDNPDKDDFFVSSPSNIADRVASITDTLRYFLAAVAGISLVVGGIGIMTIMLVSVTERTREIGLRKALGATERDILKQFLIESVVLTVFGGLVGIVVGVVAIFLIAFAIQNFAGFNWDFTFPVEGALIGLCMAFSVGIVFGMYPAKKASRKDPIDALDYE